MSKDICARTFCSITQLSHHHTLAPFYMDIPQMVHSSSDCFSGRTRAPQKTPGELEFVNLARCDHAHLDARLLVSKPNGRHMM